MTVLAAVPTQPSVLPTTLTITPWTDPVVDPIGHHTRSDYVETFWLPIIGPTATVMLRRLGSWLDAEPTGFDVDTEACAALFGLSTRHAASQFPKAWTRLTMFGLAHTTGAGFAVRRMVPPLSARQLARLPEDLQTAHREHTSP